VAAVILALGGAGIVYDDSEERVTGPDTKTTAKDAFEVEVERANGGQVKVHLDGDLNVVGQEADEDGPTDQAQRRLIPPTDPEPRRTICNVEKTLEDDPDRHACWPVSCSASACRWCS
jgi:hypothetical protein